MGLIKMKLQIITVMLLSLASFSCGGKKSTLTSQQKNNLSQQKNYPTPFAAFANSTPWGLKSQHINEVLSGKNSILLPDGLKIYLESTNSIASFKGNFEFGKQLETVFKRSSRDEAMLSNTRKFFKKNDPKTLYIVFAGFAHAFDYFLDSNEHKPLYVAPKLTKNTGFRTEEFHKFVSYITKKGSSVKKAEGVSGPLYTSMITKLAYMRDRNKDLSAEKILKTDIKSSSKNKYFFSDVHEIREFGWIETLPSLEMIKDKKIARVELGLEGLKFGKRYSLDKTMNYHYDFKIFLSDDVRNFLEKSDTPAGKLYRSGKVQTLPALRYLLKKIHTYQEAGVKVDITGLENSETMVPDEE